MQIRYPDPGYTYMQAGEAYPNRLEGSHLLRAQPRTTVEKV